MKMPDCRYAVDVAKDDSIRQAVVCQLLSDSVGFRCGTRIEGRCAACLAARENTPEAMDAPAWRAVRARYLMTRIKAGEAPRYNGVNPMDARDAFVRLAGLVTKTELQETLTAAVGRWARILPADGGLEPEEIETKAHEIAADHDLKVDASRLEVSGGPTG